MHRMSIGQVTQAAAVCAMLCVCAAAHGQRSGGSQTPTVLEGNAQDHRPSLPGDDERDDSRLQEQARRGRNLMRQQRMVDDANRLLALATQIREQIARHGEVTAEDQRRLQEIERLARSVKDRMKG